LKEPIFDVPYSANQRLPSGPDVMWTGRGFVPGTMNSVMPPFGSTRAIRLPLYSVNQMLPSGPAVMPNAMLLAVGIGKSVMAPVGEMRPILLAVCS
jgi:hypothetical protein